MAPAKGRAKAKANPPPKSQTVKGKRANEKLTQENVDSSSEEEALATTKDDTKPKRNKAKVVLSSREKRQVRRVSRSYIDEEAEEDDEIEASEEEEEEDKAFIDDRDEEEMTDAEATDDETRDNKENVDEEEEVEGEEEAEEEEEVAEEAEVEEEKPVTPPPVQRKRRVVQSPVEPQTPRATRSKAAANGTPKSPTTARRTPGPKKKTSKQADGNDSDVVEIPKPSDGSPVKTKSKSKGKARANITFLDGPIKMPAANVEDKNKPGPIVDPEYNPFVSDEEMEIDKPVEENSDASPRKKMKTVSGKAKATKTSPRKNKKEHDTVNDTPVTGMSRIMEKSAIVSDEDEDEEDDELPTPQAASGVERVSDPNNPDHASLMCKYMKAAYRSPYTPPPITDARTILLCPPSKVPISFVNFGDAMRAVGVKKDSPLWKRFFTIVTQDIYGPFTYNLARIDPNLVRMNRGTGQYATPTFNILKNISLSNGWSATAGVAFVMFGSVSLSYLLEGQLVDGRWGRFINIRLLPMEFYRAMNILASKFGLQELAAARFNGFKFGTVPTKRKYGEEVATPRKRRLPKGDESEEPEIDVPSASVGGKEIQRVSPLKTRAEIQTLAGRGRLFNTDDIPIYDYTDLLNEKELPKFNQELLHGAKVWTRGEIPEDSWVCVHYVPSTFHHSSKGHVDIQWNLLRIVVLALPVPEDD